MSIESKWEDVTCLLMGVQNGHAGGLSTPLCAMVVVRVAPTYLVQVSGCTSWRVADACSVGLRKRGDVRMSNEMR